MIHVTEKIELPHEAKRAVTTFKELMESLTEEEIEIVLKKYRQKRSLDSNAYYWRLVGLLSDKVGINRITCHNLLLRRYGALQEVDGELVRAMIPDTEEAEKRILDAEFYHLKPTSQVTELADGKSYRTYCLLKGSSKYNSKEMATLIDGAISECREMEIPDAEIATNTEWEQLEERYGIKRQGGK